MRRFGRGKPGWCISATVLPARVITIAGLHLQPGPFCGQVDLAISRLGAGSIGCVTDAVLVAQLFFELRVDGRDRTCSETSKKLPPVSRDMRSRAFLPAALAKDAIVGSAIGKQDGIDQRVGALGGFDGARQADFAAVVHAIRQQDERLSAGLFSRSVPRRRAAPNRKGRFRLKPSDRSWARHVCAAEAWESAAVPEPVSSCSRDAVRSCNSSTSRSK